MIKLIIPKGVDISKLGLTQKEDETQTASTSKRSLLSKEEYDSSVRSAYKGRTDTASNLKARATVLTARDRENEKAYSKAKDAQNTLDAIARSGINSEEKVNLYNQEVEKANAAVEQNRKTAALLEKEAKKYSEAYSQAKTDYDKAYSDMITQNTEAQRQHNESRDRGTEYSRITLANSLRKRIDALKQEGSHQEWDHANHYKTVYDKQEEIDALEKKIREVSGSDWEKAGKAVYAGAEGFLSGMFGAAATALKAADKANVVDRKIAQNEAAALREAVSELTDAERQELEKSGKLAEIEGWIAEDEKVLAGDTQMDAVADKLRAESKKSSQHYEELVSEATAGAGTVGKIAVDVTVNGVQQILDKLSLGTPLFSMAVRSFGYGAMEAEEKGLGLKQQVLYGLKSAAIETITEKLFDGNPVYDTDAGWVNKAVGNVLERLGKDTKGSKLLEALASKPMGILTEGLEEILSDILNPIADAAITGEYDSPELEEVLYDGLIGSISALVGAGTVGVQNAAVNALDSIQTASAEKKLNKAVGQLTEAQNRSFAYVQAGMESGDEATKELATGIYNELMQEGLSGKEFIGILNSRQADIGKVARSVSQEAKTGTATPELKAQAASAESGTEAHVMSEQEQTVLETLRKSGMTDTEAAQDLTVFARIADGDLTLTKSQLDKLLDLSDSRVQAAFTEITGVEIPGGVRSISALKSLFRQGVEQQAAKAEAQETEAKQAVILETAQRKAEAQAIANITDKVQNNTPVQKTAQGVENSTQSVPEAAGSIAADKAGQAAAGNKTAPFNPVTAAIEQRQEELGTRENASRNEATRSEPTAEAAADETVRASEKGTEKSAESVKSSPESVKSSSENARSGIVLNGRKVSYEDAVEAAKESIRQREGLEITDEEAGTLVKYIAEAQARGISLSLEDAADYAIVSEAQSGTRGEAVTAEQKLTAQLAKAVLSEYGIRDVVILRGSAYMAGKNAEYNHSRNTIYVNGDRMTTQGAILWAIGHEVVHPAAGRGEAVDSLFLDEVFDAARIIARRTNLFNENYRELLFNAEAMDAEIENRLKKYQTFLKAEGRDAAADEYTREDARTEIAADTMGVIMTSPDALKILYHYSQETNDIFGRIRSAADRWVERASRKDYAGKAQREILAELNDRLKAAELSENEPLVSDAEMSGVVAPGEYEVVSRSYASLARAAGFVAVNVKDAETRYWARPDGSRVSEVTVDDIKRSLIGQFIDASVGYTITAEQAETEYELFSKVCSMAIGTNDFGMSMAAIGSGLFTALKTNSDKQYSTTYDFSSICQKTQAVIDLMSKKMVEKGSSLSKEEIMEVYNEVWNSGNPVPCPECYVFSRWVGIGGLLDKVKRLQTKFADLNPDDVRAKYDAIMRDLENKKNETNAKIREENKHLPPSRQKKEITLGRSKEKLVKEYTEKYAGLLELEEELGGREMMSRTDREQLAWYGEAAQYVDALSWIDTVYFTDSTHKYARDKSEVVVPDEILFDLNKGAEFASDYSAAWAFRTTQGAYYGKAITPYAEATLGEGVLAMSHTNDVIKQKLAGYGELAPAKPGKKKGKTNYINYQWLGEDGKLTDDAKKQIETARKKQLKQLFLGGQRWQSTSDATYENASDYLLAALEMQVTGAGVQVYTKVDGAVPAFSTWNASVNQSLMPLGGGIDANGNTVDTSTGGMSTSVARKNRNAYDTAGTITIGVNDEHIRKMFYQTWRDFVIPYHKSGGDTEMIAQMRAVQDRDAARAAKVESSDYTTTQGDKVLSDIMLSAGKEKGGWSLSEEEIALVHARREQRIAILTGKANKIDMGIINGSKFLSRLYSDFNGGKWDGVTLTKDTIESQIFPAEFWNTEVDYDNSGVNTQAYLDYCRELGFLHRFSGTVPRNGRLVSVKGRDKNGNETLLTDLAYQYDESGNKTDEIEPFFWKSLVDRRMYDNDGKYQDQRRISLANVTAEEGKKIVENFARNNAGRTYSKEVSELLREGKMSPEDIRALKERADTEKVSLRSLLNRESTSQSLADDRYLALAEDSEKITVGMNDSERAKIIQKKTLPVIEYAGSADTQIDENARDLESKKRSLISSALERIKEEFSIPEVIANDDFEMLVTMSSGLFRESESKQITDPKHLAKLIPVLERVVKSAVGIEIHTNRYYFDTTTVLFSNLIGGYVDGEWFIPVRFGIKHLRNGKNYLYVAIDDEAIKMTEVIRRSSHSPNENGNTADYSVAVSVADVIRNVKSGDILKYAPDELLTEEKRKTKYEAIADTIRRTNDKNDKHYRRFVSTGNMRSAQQAVDAAANEAFSRSMAADSKGKLLPLYHQTDADFTAFDTGKAGAGARDSLTPFGVFLKPTNADIGLKGQKQMRLYANIQKPLTVRDREDLKYRLAKMSPEYETIAAKEDTVNEEFKKKHEAAKNEFISFISEWRQNHPNAGRRDIYDAEGFDAAFEAEDRVTEEWGKKLDALAAEAKETITRALRENGYDGVHILRDAGSFGRSTETWIALDPEQVKSADPVTYDADGNIIPLSERFRTDRTGDEAWKNEDIRYSLTEEENAETDNTAADDMTDEEFRKELDRLTEEKRKAEDAKLSPQDRLLRDLFRNTEVSYSMADDTDEATPEIDEAGREELGLWLDYLLGLHAAGNGEGGEKVTSAGTAGDNGRTETKPTGKHTPKADAVNRAVDKAVKAEERKNTAVWMKDIKAQEAAEQKRKADTDRFVARLEAQRERYRKEAQRERYRKLFAVSKAETDAAVRLMEQRELEKARADDRLKKKTEQLREQAAERLRVAEWKVLFRERSRLRKEREKAKEIKRNALDKQRVLYRPDAKQARSLLRDRRADAPELTNAAVNTIRTLHDAPKKSIRERLKSVSDTIRKTGHNAYANFVNRALDIDLFSRLENTGIEAGTLVNQVFGASSSTEFIYRFGLTDTQGNIIGKSMREAMVMTDEKGRLDREKQAILQDAILHRHNIDRMSIEERALERVNAFEAKYQWLADMTAEKFALFAAQTEDEAEKAGTGKRREIARTYLELLRQWKEAKNKPVFADEAGNPVTAETSRAIWEKYKAENDWLEAKCDEIEEWWDSFMRQWAVGVSISQEDYEAWRELYPHYVPTYRESGKGPGAAVKTSGGTTATWQIFHRAGGGTSTVKPIESSFADLAQRIVRQYRVNELFRNVIDASMLDDSGELARYAVFDWDGYYANTPGLKKKVLTMALLNGEDLQGIDNAHRQAIEDVGGGVYRVTAWADGQQLSAFVSEDLFKSLRSVTDQRGDIGDFGVKLMEAGNKLTGPSKTFITGINPVFAVNNVSRDLPTALINSVAGPAFMKYWAQAWAGIASESSRYRAQWEQFQALGGTNFGYYGDSVDFARRMTEKDKLAKKAEEKLGRFNEVTESVTRFAEYLATIDRMGDSYESRLQGVKNAAEVTVDFSRAGRYGKVANSIVLYWNPTVQGIDKMVRSVFGNGKTVKQRFLNGGITLTRAALTAMLPEVALRALIKALGREDEWKEFSDRIRDNYYLIPMKGENNFWKIPKNREWAALLGTPLMRILDGTEGRDNIWENYYEDCIAANFDVLSWPFVIDQLVALETNETFSGARIEPYQAENAGDEVNKMLITDDSTSVLGYGTAAAWNAVVGTFADDMQLSPVQADYLLEDYFGSFYGTLKDLLPLNAFRSGDGQEQRTAEDILNGLKENGAEIVKDMSKTFVADNRYSNYYTSRYYDILDQLDGAIYDASVTDPEGYKDSVEYKMNSALESTFGAQISELNKQVKELPAGEEKDALKEQIADIAMQACEFYDEAVADGVTEPALLAKYQITAGFGEELTEALIDLEGYADEYRYNPSIPTSAKYTDPEDKEKEYVLDDDAKAKRKELYYDCYEELLTKAMKTAEYRKADDAGKAALLAQARDGVTEAMKERLFQWLKENGYRSQKKK